VRIEVAALAVVDGAIGEHHQLGAVANPLDRLLLEALDRPLGRLGLEQGDVDRHGAVAERLPEVLEQVGPLPAGDPPVSLVRQRSELVVAAEDDRERGLDRAGVLLRGVQRRTAAEHGASREVLDLTLAVDRGIGDDRDGLLEVVGEVLALGAEGRERAVVAQRADRLGAVVGHLLAELHVVALPAEASQHAVRDLHRLGRAGGRVAGDVGALQRPAGLQGAVVAGDLAAPAALDPALGDQALHLGVLVEPRPPLLAVDRDEELLPRPERERLGHHVGDAHHPGLGAEDEVVGRLELPQRAQAKRVGGEHALVVVARDQRHRPLGEGAERLAQVHVERVQVGRQRGDLVDDRRHDQLHRLGQREAALADQRVDRAVEVLRVRASGLNRHVEHPRLLAELGDGVDLAVVAESRERLHPLERRPGVGRVAVVTEAADGLEALVAQVGVVGAEHLRRAHDLVHARGRRERGHVKADLLLELDHEVEEHRVALAGVG
jgi:hypothetical protein